MSGFPENVLGGSLSDNSRRIARGDHLVQLVLSKGKMLNKALASGHLGFCSLLGMPTGLDRPGMPTAVATHPTQRY